MSSVVPSQICAFIDREFRYIPAENTQPQSQTVTLSDQVCPSMRALIALLEKVPVALQPGDPIDFGALISSIESINYHVKRAETQDLLERARCGPIVLFPGPNSGNWNPVRVIRQVLERCPDEMTPADSKDLPFIKDVALRAELLTDLTSARSALMNSEWKPSTVIAGSLAEALLLWVIDQKTPDEIRVACAGAVTNKALKNKPPTDPQEWGLEQYIAVATELGLIEPDTHSQLKIVQEFRNLIHPGRARRKSRRCDRGTALAANAGVELLSRDLQLRFP